MGLTRFFAFFAEKGAFFLLSLLTAHQKYGILSAVINQ